ncbi:hypothetical protein F2P81_004124 [Scophthalmus maximus]|uniref:Uncharacterized protein n=1 Tax=Scophthalmus maximus TaxID=52904 RepID=A0A6A4T8W1_SCOMX|nr:hypothetical protein F2P81_004124 [Scophthalmus maximus]
MAPPFAPAFHGPFGKGAADPTMDVAQQPKKRSHMDDSGSWDIVKATQFGILERCKELVDAGYDVRLPDKENVTLLHWAAINNRAELVKYYISKGAIVDQLGGDLNSTPLHWAIRQGQLPMVIQLMRYGADPSVADGEGYRALHLAILFQHMAIAAYLMAKGQEVDGPDCNGQTPLMLAAQKIIGPEPTNFLIKNNASVSAVDKVNRNTPLHCAVLAGNVDAAHILLDAGASVDAENINGHTPIDLAHQVHSPLLIHMLNAVKRERIRSNSRCLRIVNRYRVILQVLLCTAMFGSVGAIVDMNSESWLLKGVLLACVIGVVNLAMRHLPSPAFQSLLPAASLVASVFWMLVTWFLWFLPDILVLEENLTRQYDSYCTDKEADESAALLQLRRLRGEAGPPLGLDQRLHRCEEPSLLHPVPAGARVHGSLDVLRLSRVLGVVRNLVSFFHLRCCGLVKPAVIDWTQQFPPGREQPLFGQADLV